MTQRKAWLWIAETWDKPRKFRVRGSIRMWDEGDGWWYAGAIMFGLCESINVLFSTGRISVAVREAMFAKIRKGWDRRHELSSAYRWGHTRADARKRAAFCREQAKLLEPKGGKR